MTAEVLVIGGGIAGPAAACRLARGGRRVVLLEREAMPRHKVCGEFLSTEAETHLPGLGLAGGPGALGAAAIERTRLIAGSIAAEAPLPFRGWGLSRRRLDGALLDLARDAGAEIRLGQPVRALRTAGDGVEALVGEGAVRAGCAVLATGKHELRGHARPAPASPYVGLKLHLALAPGERRAIDGHVELVLFPGGYAGLQPVEDGIATLCLLVTAERFAGLERDWRRLVAAVPHLASRLAGAEPLWPRPLAIAGVPYGYAHAAPDTAPVYRVGDQMAVIPSFTGDGMAMALHGAAAAADAILAGRPPAALHAELREAFAASMRTAGLVARAAALPGLQPVLAALCRSVPGLMTSLARRTRISACQPAARRLASAPLLTDR